MVCESCQSELTYTVADYSLDKKTAQINTEYTLATVPKPSHTMFNKENLTAKTSEQIQEIISSFEYAKQVEIKFSPFWAKKSPRLKEGIQIIIL